MFVYNLKQVIRNRFSVQIKTDRNYFTILVMLCNFISKVGGGDLTQSRKNLFSSDISHGIFNNVLLCGYLLKKFYVLLIKIKLL